MHADVSRRREGMAYWVVWSRKRSGRGWGYYIPAAVGRRVNLQVVRMVAESDRVADSEGVEN